MKKTISALLLIAVLASICLMSGCGLTKTKDTEPAAAAEPEHTPTPEPTPTPVPDTTPATVLVDDLPAALLKLERGTEVEVQSESGEYYLCRINDNKLYIEKRFVRLINEKDTEWEGFVLENAEFFDDIYLTHSAGIKADKGIPVTVFAEMGLCLGVRFEDGRECYTKAEYISADDPMANSGAYSGFEPTDGGDIQLSSNGDFYFSFLSGGFPTKGYIRADGVEAYYCFFYRGDLINVIKTENATAEILYFQQVLTVSEKFIRGHNKAVFVAWEGYAQNDAIFFGDFRMQTEPELIKANTNAVVLEEFEDCYYVEVNGKRGFMPLECIGDSEAEPPVTYYGGGYSGYNEGGEWTDPAL